MLCRLLSRDGDANVNHYDIGVAIAAGETMVDVSAKDGFQIATGRDRSDARPVFVPGSTVAITFTVTFSKGAINLWDPDPTLADETGEVSLVSSQDAFGLDDLFVEAFDREGRSLGAFSLANVAHSQKHRVPILRLLPRSKMQVLLDGNSSSELMKIKSRMPMLTRGVAPLRFTNCRSSCHVL